MLWTLALMGCTETPLPAARGVYQATPLAIGAAAPAFELADVEGALVDLADLRGQVVVLEWFSTECPFVQHAHSRGPLEDAPQRWAEQGVQWVAINSNAEGKAGSDRGQTRRKARGFDLPRAPLLDRTGQVGLAYGAKVTPELFVIDAQGVLVFHGGPDNAPLGTLPQGEQALNFIEPALKSTLAGTPVERPESLPYGCTVKY